MKSPGTRALARPRQTFLHQNEAQPEGSHSPLSLELDPPAQTLTLQPLSSSQGLLWPEDHTFLILLFLTFFIPGREHSCPCHRQSPNTHTHIHSRAQASILLFPLVFVGREASVPAPLCLGTSPLSFSPTLHPRPCQRLNIFPFQTESSQEPESH